MISVGIDLGTTNSVCASIENGNFKYVKFQNKDSLPSVLMYSENRITVGEIARRRSVLYANNFIKSSKTSMGDFDVFWDIDNRKFSPTDVAEEILKNIRENIERQFNTSEKIEAVITVPAYFKSSQKDETRQAGIRAGFDVKQIITEPVAAAIAYGFENHQNANLFIVDLGGGTFDVSILEVTHDGSDFNVIAVDGDAKLGGDDFDNVILNLFIEKIKTETQIDFSSQQQCSLSATDYANAKQKLIEKAEQLKIDLSKLTSDEVLLPNLFNDYSFEFMLTRDEFEQKAMPLFEKVKNTIQRILDNNPNYAQNIDKVILVGGSAYLPYIQNLVEKQFGKKPLSNMDLTKLVAMGAAIVCDNENALLKRIHFQDIIVHSLGIETKGNTFAKIIKAGQQYPCCISERFTTVYDFQDALDINIFEGEDESNVDNNDFYGGFTLSNILSDRAGIPKIDVQFEYDKSGILNVTAKDLHTGSNQSKSIDIKLTKGIKREKKTLTHYDFVVLLDVSGSMGAGEKIEVAKQSCLSMINQMIDLSLHKVALISFDSDARILSHLSQDLNTLNTSIRNIRASGTTNMSKAFKLAQDIFKNADQTKIAILFTDGEPDSKENALTEAIKLKDQQVKLYTIGVGGDADTHYLKKIASDTNSYYFANDIHKLKDIFKSIVDGLTRA